MALHEQPLSASLFEALPLSPVTPCSYFTDRLSRHREFRLSGEFDPDSFAFILERGYRRCGDVYYQVNCPACNACRCYRILVDGFQPSRSQRRVLRLNEDVEARFVQPEASAAKEELYLRYQYEQHHCKDLARRVPTVRHMTYNPDRLLKTLYFQMYTNPSTTVEIELRLAGDLIGFGIIDVATKAGSAVYFAYDPEHYSRSLGTLAILRGVEWARRNDLTYYYLGHHIPGHPKMDYKKHFRPAEFLDSESGEWCPMTEPR